MSTHSETATAEVLGPRGKDWRWWLGRMLTPALVIVAGLLVIAALGVAQRAGWLSAGEVTADAGGGQQPTYTCPMHPQIRRPEPDRCPICGMNLEPVAKSSSVDLNELSVKIDPAQRRLADIQTATVKREPVTATIETIGAIAIDESRMATIASYVDGRLVELFADYTGVRVKKNDHLAVIFSPALYAAQAEYLETRRALAEMGPDALPAVKEAQQRLEESARRRLVEFGMTQAQIKQIEDSGKAQSRLTIYAPSGGTVIEKLAVAGKYVKAGDPIYRIAELSTVWLMLELYPEDAGRIRFAQQVEAEAQSMPGKKLTGRVAFIDPTVDPQKRTVGVRVELLNENRELRPGDYATAKIRVPIEQTGKVYDADLAGKWISPMHPQVIEDEPGKCRICGMDLVPTSRYGYSDKPVEQPPATYVPRSAVLMAGDNSVVYVESKAEPGRFYIRPVELGPILRNKVVILDGLNEAETVATSGNFLIDSQMQLEGKPSLIDPGRAVAAGKKREGPLKFDRLNVQPVRGELGQKIEQLYAAYSAVQKSLAADKKPREQAATELHRLAAVLSHQPALSAHSRTLLEEVADASEHLLHMDLSAARKAFIPISHAVVELATTLRGEATEAPLFHFFCPMVKGGGDWLQSADDLRNPYYGSQMLRCGEKVHEFPPKSTAESETKGEPTE